MRNKTQYNRTDKSMESKNTFSRTDSRVIEETSMSVNERFILIYILAQSDNWVINSNSLWKQMGMGKQAFYTAWKSLQSMGFVIKHAIIDRETGQRFGTEWVINEWPFATTSSSSDSRNPEYGKAESNHYKGTTTNNNNLSTEADATEEVASQKLIKEVITEAPSQLPDTQYGITGGPRGGSQMVPKKKTQGKKTQSINLSTVAIAP